MQINGHLFVDGEPHAVFHSSNGVRSVRLEIAEPGQPVEPGITIHTGAIDPQRLILELKEAAEWADGPGAARTG